MSRETPGRSQRAAITAGSPVERILSASARYRLAQFGLTHELEQVPADQAVGVQFGRGVLAGETVQSATTDRDNPVIRIDGIGNAVHRLEKLFQHWINPSPPMPTPEIRLII